MISFRRAPAYKFSAEPDMTFDSRQTLELVQTLLSLGRVAFMIRARADEIEWFAFDLSGKKDHIPIEARRGYHVKRVRYGRSGIEAEHAYRVALKTQLPSTFPTQYIHDLSPLVTS